MGSLMKRAELSACWMAVGRGGWTTPGAIEVRSRAAGRMLGLRTSRGLTAVSLEGLEGRPLAAGTGARAGLEAEASPAAADASAALAASFSCAAALVAASASAAR